MQITQILSPIGLQKIYRRHVLPGPKWLGCEVVGLKA